MLETIREFAAEQLDLVAETVTLRSRHAAWVVELVNELASDLRRLDPSAVARMQPEHDNIRAALRWSIEGGELGVATLVIARLCVYWITKGLGTEGARYADRLLERRGTSLRRNVSRRSWARRSSIGSPGTSNAESH